MPNNELQPYPKYVYTFRTRFDKDIAQKNEKPQTSLIPIDPMRANYSIEDNI